MSDRTENNPHVTRKDYVSKQGDELILFIPGVKNRTQFFIGFELAIKHVLKQKPKLLSGTYKLFLVILSNLDSGRNTFKLSTAECLALMQCQRTALFEYSAQLKACEVIRGELPTIMLNPAYGFKGTTRQQEKAFQAWVKLDPPTNELGSEERKAAWAALNQSFLDNPGWLSDKQREQPVSPSILTDEEWEAFSVECAYTDWQSANAD